MDETTKNIVEGDIDKVIYERFFDGKQGLFVDVGAARPDFLSISALFRGLGWRVIAVEPNPVFAELQKKAGSEVLQYACGIRDEDNVDFTIVDQHGESYMGGGVSYESFSSLGIKKEFLALKSELDYKTIKVNMRRLDTLLKDCSPIVKHVDVLSIDVEGWEMEVLDGFNVNEYRPKVMIIENLFRSDKYVSRLNSDGYLLWRRSYPNDIYVLSSSPLLIRKTISKAMSLYEKIQTALRNRFSPV